MACSKIPLNNQFLRNIYKSERKISKKFHMSSSLFELQIAKRCKTRRKKHSVRKNISLKGWKCDIVAMSVISIIFTDALFKKCFRCSGETQVLLFSCRKKSFWYDSCKKTEINFNIIQIIFPV